MGLSRRGELKVSVYRHNGEGLPPHGGGTHFSQVCCMCFSHLPPMSASYLMQSTVASAAHVQNSEKAFLVGAVER